MNYLEVINELNEELFEKHGADSEFEYRTNGSYDAICFRDVIIWDSENDGREFIEEEDNYEPFIPYIKREFNKYIKDLSKLKF